MFEDDSYTNDNISKSRSDVVAQLFVLVDTIEIIVISKFLMMASNRRRVNVNSSLSTMTTAVEKEDTANTTPTNNNDNNNPRCSTGNSPITNKPYSFRRRSYTATFFFRTAEEVVIAVVLHV